MEAKREERTKEKQYIQCAKIINTHGCYGALKLESWCNSPEDLAKLKTVFLKKGAEYTAYRVSKASVFKQTVLAVWESVDSMDAALALKGQIVYAKRADFQLADGEYFIADLNGLDVIDANNGAVYGKVTDVINRGASDIYVIQTPNGERMMPAVKEFVQRVDVQKGVFVTPIDGMLTD